VAPSSSVPWQRTGLVGRRAHRLPPTAYTFHHSSVYDQRLSYPSTADDYNSYSAYRLRKTKTADTLAPPSIELVFTPCVPFPYPCPVLCPPIVRATCPTPTSALPALAASSYPIPARLPSPSHSTPGPHASRSHTYIHAYPARLSPFHTHHAVHYTLSSSKAAAPSTAYPIPQSSDDTRIADLSTVHHNFPFTAHNKHRSYLNTANYYLDSTDYRLTKTKTDTLTQRLAEFSYMHAYYSFQSELRSGCLERNCGIVQSLSSHARSILRIVGTTSSDGSLGSQLGSRSAL
jgi:hypothetical protein